MAVITLNRNRNTPSAEVRMVFMFDEPQAAGVMLAATAAGAAQVADKYGNKVPRFGDSLAGAPGLIAVAIKLTAHDSRTWEASVSYSNYALQFKNGAEGQQPWEQRAIVRWSPLNETEVQQLAYQAGDLKGEPTLPLQLPNGRAYYDPPVMPIAAAQGVVTWNTRSSIASAISAVEFTVNSAAITLGSKTLAAGQGYLQSINENEEYLEDGSKYYSHEAIVYYRRDGHKWAPVSLDYYAIIDGKLQRVQIKDGVYGYWGADDPDALDVSDPVYLNSSGGLLATNAAQTSGLIPNVRRWQIRYPANWAVLEIE